MAAGPLNIMMAPFPEGFNADLDEQWQQAVQLMEGSVVLSTSSTPERLFFYFLTPWPVGWKGTLNQTWAKGVSLMGIKTATTSTVIPLSIVDFPEDFRGTLNETWQQGLKLISGLVP